MEYNELTQESVDLINQKINIRQDVIYLQKK